MKKNYLIYTFKILIVCLCLTASIFANYGLLCVFKQGSMEYKSVAAKPVFSVVIDPGHGGRDGGASSNDGTSEKELNLELSRSMSDFLFLCGVENTMTRRDDSLVCDENAPELKGKIKMTDLKNRLEIAESNPSGVFVSIHMNKFPIEKYKGLQVYYSVNNEKSEELAKSVQENVKNIMQPQNDRRIKAAGSNIFLLDRITLPAILIECGFLSNNEEAKLLSTNEYRTKLSLIIAESIIQYHIN